MARLSYAPMTKNSKEVSLKLTERLHNVINRLADIDHRSLRDQIRHLLEVAIRYEVERLDHQAESADEVAAAMELEHKRLVRKVLAEAGKDNSDESSDLRESQHGKQRAGSNDADARAQGIHRAPRMAACR